MVIRDTRKLWQVIDVICRLEEFIENINHDTNSRVVDFRKLWLTAYFDGINADEFCLAIECMADEGSLISSFDEWLTPEIVTSNYHWVESLSCL